MNFYHFHTFATVLCAGFFAGVVCWAYSGRRKSEFREAEQLPFLDESGERS